MKQLSRQARLVRVHLRTDTLTSWQAEGVYRIRRLASRIDELRAAGFEIDKERRQDATGQAYTAYSFTRRQKRSTAPLLLPRDPERRFTLDEIETAVHAWYRHWGNSSAYSESMGRTARLAVSEGAAL